jgi:MFS family permease
MWFGVQLIWGAVLGISLQSRSEQLAGGDALHAFAVLATSGAIAAAIVQLLVGPLSDRLRSRGGDRSAFYIGGAALGACAVVAFYSAPTLPLFFAAYIALQIALNVAGGPYQAIVPDALPRERYGAGAAWLAGYAAAGNALGALCATLLGTTALLGATLATILVVAAAGTVAHLRGVQLQHVQRNAHLVVTRALVDLWISRAFVYLGFYTLLDYVFFYVKALLPHGFTLDPTRASGACVLLFTLLGIAGAVVAGRPSDRIDERRIVTIGGATVAAAAIVLGALPLLGALPIMIGIAGVGWGVFLCADWAFACRVLPAGALATTMAIWNLAIVVPQMLATLVAGLLLSHLGATEVCLGPRVAMALAGAEILIGTLWVWRLPYVQSGK